VFENRVLRRIFRPKRDDLVSTIEELLERKSSGSGLENRDYCLRDPPR
jgi:hypothetical protein